MHNSERPPLYMPTPLLDWLFARQRFMAPGFERIRRLLEKLGNPQDSFASILVTGTNGKGSTTASLHSILTEAKVRTGRFTSPHLSYFAERFIVDKEMLPQAQVLERLAMIQPLAEKEGNSFFEIITALACQLFADNGVKIAVMEIGMGGQFDTTNVLEPIMSLISNISLDHTNYLGNNIQTIAASKAYVMRNGQPCFTTAREGLDVLLAHAARVNASFYALNPSNYQGQVRGWDGVDVSYNGITARSPLLGQHQIANVALAMAAAQHLGADVQAIQQGIATTEWAGRLELIPYQGRRILLDGAHNSASAQALADALQMLEVKQPIIILGVNEDKDMNGIAPPLDAIAGHIILTQSQNSPKAATPLTLAKHFQTATSIADQPFTALRKAFQLSQKNDVIVLAGSLYLVGEVRPSLLKHTSEPWERWQ